MNTFVQRVGLFALAAGLVSASPALAKPKGKTQLSLDVKPVTAQVFLDNKPMGKATAGRVIDVTPGFHIVKLTNKGDEHEERLKISPNQTTSYSFEFDEAAAPATENGTEPSPIPEDAPQKTESQP